MTILGSSRGGTKVERRGRERRAAWVKIKKTKTKTKEGILGENKEIKRQIQRQRRAAWVKIMKEKDKKIGKDIHLPSRASSESQQRWKHDSLGRLQALPL